MRYRPKLAGNDESCASALENRGSDFDHDDAPCVEFARLVPPARLRSLNNEKHHRIRVYHFLSTSNNGFMRAFVLDEAGD